ncbi:MAG TPA: nucleotidyltransferase family protein [bacterium]|nr:nucleotidyltransferase family protein [bacterium]HPM28115.1 nucleotidyltransferase family protein [bacterium]
MERQQITITLRKDIVRAIDGEIDGAKIRSRSHAIEYTLSQHFAFGLKKAVILAGGVDRKMGDLTKDTPKGMLKIKGKPILEYTISWLTKNDVASVAIVTGAHGQKIRDYFGDGLDWGIRIHYIDEGEPKGTGGALKLAKRFVGDDTFLFIYGDVLVDLNIRELAVFHENSGGVVTLAVTSTDDPSSYGAVRLSGHELVEFIEKPTNDHFTSRLVASGLHIARPDIFSFMPRKTVFSLERDFLPALTQKKKARGYVFSGQWFDIGTVNIYNRAKESWRG